ncbi:hypothetical protein G6F31_018407 [Rhizopus arrhizus]|nr:hypothetical protein G6F31_018407 [Rhizopus arrhizus]
MPLHVAGARQQQLAFAGVARHAGGALEFRVGLGVAAELGEQVAAHAGQPMVVGQCCIRRQRVDQVQPRLRAERHADGNGAVQRHHWRRHHLRERVVKRHDARPIGVLRRAGARMAGRQFGLQGIRAQRPALGGRPRQRRQPAPDQQGVPAAAVLLHQQHRAALRIGAGRQAGGLQFHQRHQPMHLAFARSHAGRIQSSPDVAE